MIRVMFFARIREALGTGGLEIDAGNGMATVDDLIGLLSRKGDQWHEALGAENLLIAVNQTVVPATTLVRDGDEVAFFPPVTGG